MRDVKLAKEYISKVVLHSEDHRGVVLAVTINGCNSSRINRKYI
jgi:hypothetical protein